MIDCIRLYSNGIHAYITTVKVHVFLGEFCVFLCFFASLLSHVSTATDVPLVFYGLNISLYLGSFGWGQIILHL